MKTYNPRLLGAVLASMAIGGALAGCGDDNDSSAGSAATTGDSGAQAAAKPAASAADVDKAFVRQMVPHHKMAVEMAQMAAKSAEHQEIKTLSSEIISAQNKEITELESIGTELGVTPDAPMGQSGAGASMMKDAKTLGLSMDQMGMSMDMAALESADPFDKAFIDEMTVHHQGAIAMAKAQLAGGENADLKKIATAIVAAQEKEAAQMAAWKADWYPGAAGSDQEAEAVGSDDMSEMGH